MFSFLAAVFGYLCGSVSSAVLVARAFSLPDPRTQGSGNPGATNILRLGGKKAAACTLLGDLLKGFLPTFLVYLLFPESSRLWVFVGLGAFFGHLYPLFFGFRGGKGVATAIGVLLVWNFYLALICIAIWLLVFALTRVSSLSALLAAFSAPWLGIFLLDDRSLLLAVFLMVGVLIARHRSNIERLIKGEESVFKKRKG